MTFFLGVTGGIATGKSTASAFFRSQNVPVIDADKIARQVVEPNTQGLKKIVDYFGPSMLKADGSLDRKKLGDIIFHDSKKREKLNQLLDFEIRSEITHKKKEYEAQKIPLVILDIPLLFEMDYRDAVQGVLLLYVAKETQCKRLMERDKIGKEEAEAKIISQMDINEKRVQSDWVIDNEGTLQNTNKQLEAWLNHFVSS